MKSYRRTHSESNKPNWVNSTWPIRWRAPRAPWPNVSNLSSNTRSSRQLPTRGHCFILDKHIIIRMISTLEKGRSLDINTTTTYHTIRLIYLIFIQRRWMIFCLRCIQKKRHSLFFRTHIYIYFYLKKKKKNS